MVPGTGLLAPCIPGAFDAYMLMLRDFGTMRLGDVMAPAIAYATGGHPLLERAAATIADRARSIPRPLADIRCLVAATGRGSCRRNAVQESGAGQNLHPHPA